MNLFKFDTSKMNWNKTLMQGTGTSFIDITFTDELYFRSLENLFLNLRNSKFKLVLIKNDGTQSFILGDIFIVNWDFIQNIPKINTIQLNNFKICVNILTTPTNLTNFTDYSLYISYE